ncbi:hypothetical protein H634G_02532 [Metarhizium anisopliae BRIP 53293]|uniref:Peptidase S1 domain-containing protein n=1 Tax=Metarhizium anisopliae BRIP 53293 TaxID=1291518 RepID=A0A0D9P865_METAN|nr:hypothetical protein H634G_02532 [Metarhizium anisopliae BRIP 53293]KJK85163.1 hypothetical protein H633G_11002 [Metarhizium anisopliae BRIP 53284]
MLPKTSRAVAVATLAVQTASARPAADEASERIVGGQKSDGQDFPFIVPLLQEPQNFQFCAGSLIAPNIVLTAAHCTEGMKDGQTSIRAGSLDSTKGGTVSAVTRFKAHENFNIKRSLKDDIALLFLEQPINNIQVAQLPKQDSVPADDATVTAAGWGKTSANGPPSKILLETSVQVVNNAQCNELYQGSVLQTMICAGGKGQDTCQGDSGGPLIDAQTKALTGLVSFGSDVCATTPGVYTRVSAYIDWIQQNSGVNPGNTTGGNPGGLPGGNPGGKPGGKPGSKPGSKPGGVTGGNPGGLPGGNPGGLPGGFPGGKPGGKPGSNSGGVTGGVPADFPGDFPEGFPGDFPGGKPGGKPGSNSGGFP